ncbi:peptide chain release factor 2 [Anatilimnocola floriformis]|uniref:peptide chain release factor 2 n=1 Tax=Anatilimnocola floriformis TaxID=2948575 RepID=UPI0036F327A0
METEWYSRTTALQQRVAQLRDSLDYDNKLKKVAEINERMAAPDFWNNQEKAREVMGKFKALLAVTKPLEEVVRGAGDLPGLLEMAESDNSFDGEVITEVERLEKLVEELELKALLNGPHDSANAIMSIYARDGGTDANDWAEMLMRMYMQYAAKNEFEFVVMDRLDNEQAGINHATVMIKGPMAYGYLKGETGLHRLVRISPFNSEGKRQTSFAAIDVSPEVEDEAEIVVDWAKDVREETMRAGGAGGQHVNKTESAIRLLHYETGIEVKCQNERSQHQNRALARKMMLARLARLADEKREAESAAQYKGKVKVGFGSQIRNYFLHPDQRVKDQRTGYLMNNFHQVMDGNIQGFMDSYLRWRMKEGGGEVAADDEE